MCFCLLDELTLATMTGTMNNMHYYVIHPSARTTYLKLLPISTEFFDAPSSELTDSRDFKITKMAILAVIVAIAHQPAGSTPYKPTDVLPQVCPTRRCVA